MKRFRFLQWQVYIEAKELLTLVLNIVKRLPKEYRYELGAQANRSAFSVVLNIAEGSGKTSDKDTSRYFDIALGSLYETLSAVDVFCDNQIVDKTEFNDIYNKAESIANQLGGFKKKLNG